MGDEVVILANSLISHFQWGLRHSALLWNALILTLSGNIDQAPGTPGPNKTGVANVAKIWD